MARLAALVKSKSQSEEEIKETSLRG